MSHGRSDSKKRERFANSWAWFRLSNKLILWQANFRLKPITSTSLITGTKISHSIPNDAKESVVVLGSGAYRRGVVLNLIGSVCLNTVSKEGYRSVMLNYNPETVSTDYDVCDRL